MGSQGACRQDAASCDAYNGFQLGHLHDHAKRVFDELSGRDEVLFWHWVFALVPHWKRHVP